VFELWRRVKEGMKVADFGTGDDRFSYAFKEKGAVVYAFDVDDYYFKEMEEKGIKTVKKNLCEKIDGEFDLIFMANVYHTNESLASSRGGDTKILFLC
jgi:ribosomal protein L11 methylase PrmA